VIAVYRKSRADRGLPAANHDIADAVNTASRFRIPATRLCEAQVAHQPRTFLYQFDWESPARRGALGACHGLEVPFVFGTVGTTGNDRFTGVGPEATQLSQHMMDAWLAFAKRGEPSHPGIGAWPAYSVAERQTMIFGRRCGAERAPFEEERAVWDNVLSKRARDSSSAV
jgi:para-nitrobenzyl esterase